MSSCDRALNNSVKGKTGKLDEKGNKVKEDYKFVKTLGAKNNDSEEEGSSSKDKALSAKKK